MSTQTKTIAFHTLGCKLNFSETSTISRDFVQHGFEKVDYRDKADIYVINTCSVTENANKEARKLIRKAKRRNPDSSVVVIGCYAQLKPKEIAEMDGVDMVLGSEEKFNILDHIDKISMEQDTMVIQSCIEHVNEFRPSYSIGERTRSYLKIQDGCDYTCSFCTIPLARGKSRSDNIINTMKVAQEVANGGTKEIVLTGVNVGDYGKDSDDSFQDLLTELDHLDGIERIRISAFGILAIAIGSVFWSIDASWGWHFDGWMVKILGYHDAYASGVIHAVCGGFALGVLAVLGPRIGKFASDGTPRNIGPRNPWLVTLGLFLIYTGFWGFYAACNIPIYDLGPEYGMEGVTYFTATNIYVTPTTLSGITMNFLLSLSGGLLAGYWISKGDPFWTYSSGLAGIICASAGNDLYHPLQSMIIAAIGVYVAYKMHFWVERRFKIDDAVGAVAVHGYAGVAGLVICGFVCIRCF